MSDDQRRSRTTAGLRITVLGSFGLLRDGTTVPLGVDARRLVAYLAVHPRAQQRAALAADLWPAVPAEAALRLLDEAVAAVDVPGLLAETEDTLALHTEVQVDLTEAMALVRALPGVPGAEPVDTEPLRADILPGWTAGWIAIERERFRQLRLHALEERSLRLTAAGRYEDALAMARRAVAAGPSRESARRALIEAHLAEGDIAAAVAQYDEYQELLRSSVGGPLPAGLDALLPPVGGLPVVRTRRPIPRSAVVLPGLRSVRGASGATRRLVAGGSVPGTSR